MGFCKRQFHRLRVRRLDLLEEPQCLPTRVINSAMLFSVCSTHLNLTEPKCFQYNGISVSCGPHQFVGSLLSSEPG